MPLGQRRYDEQDIEYTTAIPSSYALKYQSISLTEDLREWD